MHLLRKFDRLPCRQFQQGGALMNYVGIDHHRQYSHMTVMDSMGQVLRSGRVPNLQKEIGKFLEGFEAVETRIAESTALVEKLYEEIREAQLIRTIPGFGKYLSVLVAVEIADLSRFADAAHLHAYAGVIPSVHSSGDRTHYGKIIRTGNRWLRWAAVEAVWPAIRADFDLRCFYERLARRKGANKAKVAAARRLLIIIYKVWKEQRNYIPYRR
jgi:transposase